MSVPGRLHITWQDDSTLKVETDAGMQTRLLRFGDVEAPADAPRTWQGVSVAQWQTPRPNVPLLLRPAERTADAPAVVPTGGSLRVVTTNLRAGYLRKNGVPYSENAVLTEHWDLYKRPNGEEWLTITTQVDDPQYLRTPRLVAPIVQEGAERRQVGPDAVLVAMVARCPMRIAALICIRRFFRRLPRSPRSISPARGPAAGSRTTSTRSSRSISSECR